MAPRVVSCDILREENVIVVREWISGPDEMSEFEFNA